MGYLLALLICTLIGYLCGSALLGLLVPLALIGLYVGLVAVDEWTFWVRRRRRARRRRGMIGR